MCNGIGGTELSRQVREETQLRRVARVDGRGIVGFEIDFGYSPNFFEGPERPGATFEFTNDSNVTTL